ncbi:MAG: hypothetical protein P4L68_10340 [Methylovirgula sp.]|nr:hypothetical protein [Methylovirgula sp.]
MADDFSSPRRIAELNIEHFTRLLQTPLDEQTRKIVERLLVAERAKLASPPDDPTDDPPRPDKPQV